MTGLPITRRQALALAGVLVVVLVVAGRQLGGRAGGGTGAAVAPLPADVAAKAKGGGLVVQVVGAVRRPGLYRLAAGSRVADAVSRAGGATRRADTELINLAAPLADGTQIVVPRKAAPGAAPGGIAGAGGSAGGEGEPQGPIHLNTATLADLDSLPGIGPVTAQRILDYRQKHGAFSSVDDLDAVPGIGPARMAQLRDLVAP
jgi:competence protein ComEA